MYIETRPNCKKIKTRKLFRRNSFGDVELPRFWNAFFFLLFRLFKSVLWQEYWVFSAGIKTRKFFTWQVENKQFKASVLWMNNSRIHRNIKIARDDSTVTLGCSDWCGLALSAWERISEQAFIFHSKSGWCSTWGFLHCDDRRSLDELTAVDLGVIAVALTPAWLVWILTVMPVWLYFSSFLFCFWSRNFTYYTSVSCVWFLLPYISLPSN